jgi:hypothetical protein
MSLCDINRHRRGIRRPTTVGEAFGSLAVIGCE